MTVTKRRAIRVGLLLTLALAASLLAVSAPALADVRTGSVSDPTGDAAYAQQDITGAEVSYDTQGAMTAKVTFAAPPSADTFGAMVLVQLFKSTGPSCQGGERPDFNAVLTVPRAPEDLAPSAAIVHPAPQEVNPPTFTQADNVVTVQVTDARIANQPWDCAIVGGGTPGPTINAQDATDRIALGGGSPPPPPPPPPAPPALSAAKLRPTTLTAARSGSTFTRRGKGRLTFTLSAAATVNVALERRSGRRWRAVKGSVSLNLPAGANTLRFTGRWRGKRLARGRYRLVLAPSGPSGAGQVVRVAFRIRR
jgi:hypothetical protein